MPEIISLIPYFGGSAHVASKILEYVHLAAERFPLTSFGEVFGGGCRVLLNSPYFGQECYNEIDRGLCQLMSVVGKAESCEEMINMLKKLPYEKEIFLYARDHREDSDLNPILGAAFTYISAAQSRVGTMTSFKSYSNPADQQASIIQYYEHLDKIRVCTPRLAGVQITNRDFREPLYEHIMDEQCLFVIDPPFLPDTRLSAKVYKHELGIDDHAELVALLLQAKFKAILCGYDLEEENPLYRQLTLNGWQRVSLGLQKVASSSKKVKPTHTYYIWINF